MVNETVFEMLKKAFNEIEHPFVKIDENGYLKDDRLSFWMMELSKSMGIVFIMLYRKHKNDSIDDFVNFIFGMDGAIFYAEFTAFIRDYLNSNIGDLVNLDEDAPICVLSPDTVIDAWNKFAEKEGMQNE